MERRRAARRPSPEARGASGVQRAPPGARSAAAGGAGAVRVAGGGWAGGWVGRRAVGWVDGWVGGRAGGQVGPGCVCHAH